MRALLPHLRKGSRIPWCPGQQSTTCYFIGKETSSEGDFLNRVDRALEGLPHRRFRAQSTKRAFHDSDAFLLLWSLYAEPV